MQTDAVGLAMVLYAHMTFSGNLNDKLKK